MRLRFWGTRGSIATPGTTTLRYGGNTSCVEIESDNGALIILDCGTGAAPLGANLMQRGKPLRGHLLISHSHWDHIQGVPSLLFGWFLWSHPITAPVNRLVTTL